MSLVRTGGGVTDIRGSMAGNVFARDSSGLHVRSKPRRVNSPTPAQLVQRAAFTKARTYSKDNRTVSYLIYRALNNLPFIFDAIVTGDPDPDVTGKYVLAGQYNGEDYYNRFDGAWFIYWHSGLDRWYIVNNIEAPTVAWWWKAWTIQGEYTGDKPEWGKPFVTLVVTPPPADYNPPKL